MLEPGDCKHYNGVENPVTKGICDAGVKYWDLAHKVNSDTWGWCCRLPCTQALNRKEDPEQVVTCPKKEPLTKKEIKEKQEELESWIKQILQEMKTLQPAKNRMRKKWKGQNASEVVVCPRCTGALTLVHHASNGHIHGKCETENCVLFME